MNPLVSVKGLSDRSLVFSTFVLGEWGGGGGGGSVVIGRLVYILRIVLLSWGYIYCARNGSDSIIVLGFVYYARDGS